MPRLSLLPAHWRDRLHPLAGAYLVLALLAVVAWWLPHMSAWTLGLASVLLALPTMLVSWHRAAVRRLERLHQFAPDRWLRRWAARRVVGQAVSALAAILLTLAVLLQTPYFGTLEWSLVASAPLVYIAWRDACLKYAMPLFSHRVYAASAGTQLARVLALGTLCTAWLVAHIVGAEPPAQPLAEVAYALQAQWADVPSATIRWALDAGAWGQATLATLGTASQASWWRVVLALAVLPVTVFGYATWATAGMALPRGELRRVFGATLTADDAPAQLTRRRVLAHAIPAVLAAVACIALLWQADARLARQERWLALRALPACERIGTTAYAVGTLAKVAAYAGVMEEGMAARRASACARLAEIGRIAAANVDAYLDWYFSLGAEWTRTMLLVTGDVETLLEIKFNRLVASDPRIASVLAELDADRHYLVEVASAGSSGIGRLLEAQRLVLDERQCKVVATGGDGALPTQRDGGLRARLLASTATGVVAGAFAGALTARAMRGVSMQVAGRVLGKTAARQGVSRLGAAAATGAAAGSIVPGLGTGLGALAGAAAGVAVGAGVDVAMLAVEEKLTRPDMRRDLLAAVEESLAPLRAAFECPGRQ